MTTSDFFFPCKICQLLHNLFQNNPSLYTFHWIFLSHPDAKISPNKKTLNVNSHKLWTPNWLAVTPSEWTFIQNVGPNELISFIFLVILTCHSEVLDLFDSSSTRSFTKHYMIFPFPCVCLHHLNNQDTSDMTFHPEIRHTRGLYCLLSNCWIVGYGLVMDEHLPVTLILADRAKLTNCYHMSSNASQLTYLLSV